MKLRALHEHEVLPQGTDWNLADISDAADDISDISGQFNGYADSNYMLH